MERNRYLIINSIPVSVKTVEVADLGLMDKLVVETFYSKVLSDQVYRMMFEESLLVQHQDPTF